MHQLRIRNSVGSLLTKVVADYDEGKDAVTEYAVVDNAGRKVSWLAMRPRTGRTHQLRVHAAEGLNRPIIGALFNRLQHAMLHEAYWMIEEGYCTVEDVDKFARLAFGPRMCAGGLIEVKDLGGLVVHAASQAEIIPNLTLKREPAPFVQNLPKQGRTGADAGRGFYDWTGRDVAGRRAEVKAMTRKILDIVEPDARGTGGRGRG